VAEKPDGPRNFHAVLELDAIVDLCLSVCGPGLVSPSVSARPRVALKRRLPAWLRRFDLYLDILPTLEIQTFKPRKTPIHDPTILEDDIRAYAHQRLTESARDKSCGTDRMDCWLAQDHFGYPKHATVGPTWDEFHQMVENYGSLKRAKDSNPEVTQAIIEHGWTAKKEGE
jgi:hypothetical protein